MSDLGTVLIIDDDEDIRDMFEDLLVEEGYELRVASSGEEGLEKFDPDIVKLVLCDLTMPGMGGIEVLTKIREQSKVPCIILSGNINPQSHKLCMKAGATDILQKPIDYSYLKLRVKTNMAV